MSKVEETNNVARTSVLSAEHELNKCKQSEDTTDEYVQTEQAQESAAAEAIAPNQPF